MVTSTTDAPKVDEPVVATPTTEPVPTPVPEPADAPETAANNKDDASPLLVTSSSSRSTYADNASKLQSAIGDISGSQSYNYVDANGKVQSVQASSPEEALKKAPDRAPTSGVEKVEKAETAPTKNSDGSTSNPDGSTSNTDGTVTTADGARIDSSLKGIYDSTVKSLDDGIASAKSTLHQASATLKNNPAAQAAIALVMAKYDEQIALMKEKNKILAGSQLKNAARTGALQYANEMTENFLSEEQDKATKRVTDLITLETNMVLKTQEAYKKGDVAAFTAASKALENAKTDKIDAINKLLTATDRIVKEKQAQQRIDATAAKQKITDDLRLATGLAKTVAATIAASGIKDEKKRRAYIEQMAEANDISNPDLLESAVIKASQDNEKADLAIANTKSIIQKRGSGGTSGGGGKKYTDGSYTYTTDDVSTYTDFFNKGGTTPEGTSYNGRGSDGYVDPGAYTFALNDWVANGGTPTGFAKKFPVKGTVNPDSYSELPAAIQPAAKASSKTPG